MWLYGPTWIAKGVSQAKQFIETHIVRQFPGENKPALPDFEFRLSK